MIYRHIIKPVLFRMEAETAHDVVFRVFRNAGKVNALRSAAGFIFGKVPIKLHQNVLGLNFPGPVGLAAGFDKNGQLTALLSHSGFGFLEIGSITARPSAGNARPRSFRLPDDLALINRMGLNNDGADVITGRLKDFEKTIPLGINIAKTHDSSITGDDAVEDYIYSYKKALPVADYITVNISCPNTSDGRTFESAESLHQLLESIKAVKFNRSVPVLVKFSADIESSEMRELLAICESFDIDGYVATNTTSSRKNLKTDPAIVKAIGHGGLSGSPLRAGSLRVLSVISEFTGGEKPLIGVGGIMSVADAVERIRAGAWLIQIYTGLVYNGPGFVRTLNRGICAELDRLGLDNLEELRKMGRVKQ